MREDGGEKRVNSGEGEKYSGNSGHEYGRNGEGRTGEIPSETPHASPNEEAIDNTDDGNNGDEKRSNGEDADDNVLASDEHFGRSASMGREEKREGTHETDWLSKTDSNQEETYRSLLKRWEMFDDEEALPRYFSREIPPLEIKSKWAQL